MENQEVDITALKSLESPRDILGAVIDQNRAFDDKVLVRLESGNGEPSILLHGAYLQREADKPERTSNQDVKFLTMVEEGKLRIADIVPLSEELINAQPSMPPILRIQKAVRSYATDHGFEEDKTYQGRFVEKKKEE